jgi:hypothetical protein
MKRMIVLLCGIITVLTCGLTTAQDQPSNAVTEMLASAQEAYRAAVQAADPQRLNSAAELFTQVKTRIEGEQRTHEYRETYDLARYGIGWCRFRQTEAEGDVSHLRDAFGVFDALSRENGRYAAYAAYMAGECKLRQATLAKTQDLFNGTFGSQTTAQLTSLVGEAERLFASAAQAAALPPHVQACARIRAKDAVYEKGVLQQLIDRNRECTEFFQSANYSGIGPGSSSELTTVLNYSESMRRLNLYFCSRDESLLQGLDFPVDADYRMANLAHLQAVQLFLRDETEQAKELFRQAISNYDRAAQRGVPQAEYWRAYIELILQDENAIATFERFLQKTQGSTDHSVNVLRADAKNKVDFANVATDTLSNDQLESFLNIPDPAAKSRKALEAGKYLLMRGAEIRTYRGYSLDQLRRTYLRKALAFFGYARTSTADPLLRSEAMFFAGIANVLRATTLLGEERIRKYRSIANDMTALAQSNDKFKDEALYIKAICLYRAFSDDNELRREVEEAEGIFKTLVQNRHSVRALYWWARILQTYRVNDPAKLHCFRLICERANGKPEYSFLVSMIGGKSVCNEQPPAFDMAVFGGISIGTVTCPDYLIDGETVFYEKFATESGVLKLIAEESITKLKQFGLPKKELYPCDNRMQRSVFLANAFDNVTAQIPDLVQASTRWELKIALVAGQDGNLVDVPDCRVTIKNVNANAPRSAEECTQTACLQCGTSVEYQPGTALEIVCNDTLEVVVDPGSARYYPAHFYIAPRQSRNLDTIFALSPRLQYTTCGATSDVQTTVFRENSDRSVLLTNASASPSAFTRLMEDFNSSEDFRDFAIGSDGRYALGVRVKADRPVIRYEGNDKHDLDLNLGSYEFTSMESPEGIAVDAPGNIYITDWGHKNVVVLNRDEKFQFAFAPANGRPASDAAEPQLLFPTRIAVEEDLTPLQQNGRDIKRETHILVADGYGIHRFDSRGRYLDTPITAALAGLAPGTFYEFTITGYGENGVISLVNRKTGEVLSFCPK